MNHECPICLEEINNNTKFKCVNCKYEFHSKCIIKIDKCPMCREPLSKTRIPNNVQFNNMNFRDEYDIQALLDKFGRRTCIEQNHCFYFETLGEWEMKNNELVFRYSCMHVECRNCKIKTIMP